MRRIMTVLTVLACVFAAAVAYAQTDAEEKSSFVSFVEDQLSAPNRRISLNGLKGTLSSNVELSSITLSDADGVWLTIVEPKLIWNRTALLRGRLEIESLTARKIDYPRNAIVDESLPAPETQPFALPDLPVAVELEKLEVAEIDIGQPVFGTAARISINGRVELDGGALDADLSVDRLDAPGQLTLKTTYRGDPAELDLNMSLTEPEGGVVASLLGLQGKPPVGLVIVGKGPVDDLETTLAFDVDGKRIVDGTLELDGADGALQARARMNGPLADILPEDQRAFFGDESRIDADISFLPDGRVTIDRVLVNSGATQLIANGATLPDGFLATLNLDLRLMSPDGERVVLPGEGRTSFDAARLNLVYDAQRDGAFNASFDADGVAGGSIKVGKIDIKADGTVSNAQDPASRAITFRLGGNALALNAADEGLSQALGERIALRANGKWNAGQPVVLEQAAVTGQTLDLMASGDLTLSQFAGRLKIDAANLQAFADIADRPDLRGASDLQVSGLVQFLSGAFDLDLDGTATNLKISEDRLDPLLAGETVLSGGIERSENGLSFKTFKLSNGQLQATLNGNLKSDAADLNAQMRLADLGLVERAASGAVLADLTVTGVQKPYDLNAQLRMDAGRLSARTVDGLRLAFRGKTDLDSLAGVLDANGAISGESIDLTGDVDVTAKRQVIDGLSFSVGDTRLSGNLARAETGLVDATLSVDSNDIASAAALALIDAGGALRGNIALSAQSGKQSGSADVEGEDLRYGTYRAGQAVIKAQFADLFGQPGIEANIRIGNAFAAGVDVTSLNGTISTQGKTTSFDLDAALRQNATRLSVTGSAQQESARTLVQLAELTVKSSITDARLQQPVTLAVVDGQLDIANARLNVGSGSLRLSGSAGDQINLDVVFDALPLSIINSVRPDTGAGGTISGTASIRGTSSKPSATFDLSGSGLTVAQLRQNGIQPVRLSAGGSFSGDRLQITNVDIRNGQGITIKASGRVPLQGAGLSLSANGNAPLSLAQFALASRGASLSGDTRFNINATGSLSRPQVSGLVSISNGTLSDPISNLRLNNIGLIAGLTGDRLNIQTARANLASGGSVDASGFVLLDNGNAADISVRLNSARYTDGETFITRASGQLRVSGQLAFDPLLSGTVNLEKTEIAVPESFAGSSQLLDVKHVRPSAKVRRTLNRIDRVTPKGTPNVRPSVLRLDVTVNAPNQIFVRGRGLDAELGGQVRVTGPVTDVVPVGAFELRRGRLSIVGQRIDLDEGSIRLTGDLDPQLRFVARTRSDTVEAIITIEGRSSNLDVSFSAVPELPEDEVLAQVIFGRSVGELSPVQIARLASIAAELTGGNRPGLVDQFRAGTGLDDLDVTTDSEGNAAVRAGKYLSDRVYLGVEAGSKTKATINLDITDNITARGSVGTDGSGGVGIFLEKDY